MSNKKYSLFLISILLFLFVVGCSEDHIDNSIHWNSDLSDYSSFAMVSSGHDSRALNIKGNALLGLNKVDGKFEAITFTNSQGDVLSVSEIRKIGPDYMIIDFNGPRILVDVKRNKYMDFFEYSGGVVFQTDKGIYFKVHMHPGYEVHRVDFDSGTITPLTNRDIDPDIMDFYASKSGHFITQQWINDMYVYKFFPENGNPPLMTHIDISNYSMCLIGRSNLDFLFSPITGMKYILTNEGVKEEPVEGYIPYEFDGDIRKIHLLAADKGTNNFDINNGIMGIINNGNLRICEILNDDVVFNEYAIPFDSKKISRSLLKGDYLIFDQYDNSEIKYWNFKTGEIGSIYDGPYGSWNSSGNGILYTKYRTATEYTTVYYDIESKTENVVSNHGVDVIDAVWYEY